MNLFDATPKTSFSALTPIEPSDYENNTNKLSFPVSNPKNQQLLHDARIYGHESDTSMDMDIPESYGLMERDTASRQSPSLRCDATFQPSSQQLSRSKTVADMTASPSPTHQFPEDALWWRRPRLPSPVSENGDAMMGIKDTSDDAEMVDEVSPPESFPTTGSGNSSGMEAEAAIVRERLSSLDLPDQAKAEPPSSIKPVKKLGFSMGYRADCDKCRRKVPGHYNHIIVC